MRAVFQDDKRWGEWRANGSCAPVFTWYAYREDDRHATAELSDRQTDEKRGV
jgi:hypothetical protein